MKCPRCRHDLEIAKEEVDIGVGTQVHIIGADCPNCGEGFTPCSECGSWPWQEHRPHLVEEKFGRFGYGGNDYDGD